MTREEIAQNVTLVPQTQFLFNGSVFENISYGCENATIAQVIAAAKAAQIHDEIVALPEGYETRIGERGQRLSGGQRQRLAIARALLKNSPILILDEATSSLDTESERLVQDALTTLMLNRTSFVIAHRLSTVRRADKIIVLDRGRIAEIGRHDELIARKGVYSRLHEMQLIETRPDGRKQKAESTQ